MGNGNVDLCQPIVLKITATEIISTEEQKRTSNYSPPEMSEIDIAIIIDDVINREPRFLQKQ